MSAGARAGPPPEQSEHQSELRSEHPRAPDPRDRRPRAAVLLLLGAFAVLCAHGLAWDTPTVDEFAHLPAGVYYWKTGDLSLYPQNPPLVKLAAALPLLALRPAISTGPVENTGWFPWVYGTDFMERNRGRYDLLFLAGRLPIVAMGVLLGLLVHRWARGLYGERAGIVALALYAFCPTVVAHAHVATVDLGAALFTLWALFRFHRFLCRPSPLRFLWAGLALGLALLAKHTSLLLLPLLFLLFLGVLVARARSARLASTGQSEESGSTWSTAQLAGALAAIILLGFLVLDLGYGFQGVGVPMRELRLYSRAFRGAAARLPPGLPSPLPRAYVEGLDDLTLINEVGEYPSYLFGRFSRHGFRSYYLVALVYKTPLPFLLALLAAPFARIRRDGSQERRTLPGESFLWLPLVVLFALFSLASRVDYGLRYILPVLPLAAIYASRLVPALAGRSRALRVAAAALLALYPLSVLAATPDSLSYFNVLAGGRGDRILLDANYDWGQGLKRVRAYMDAHHLPEIGLAYFGHVDPAIYGIRWHFPAPSRPGPVAVSANFLHGYPYATYADGRILPVPPNAFTWIARYPRTADIGGGMFVYEVGR
jgi:hypothetical protein